jgi:IS4 transposase
MRTRFIADLDQVRRSETELHAVLPAADIAAAAMAAGYTEHGRLYTAATTVITFLGQVLNAQRSCRRAVSGVVAHRATTGQPAASADTGGYCKARQRLPVGACTRLVRQTGTALEQEAGAAWRWQGRRVRVVDGSTLKVADTRANRDAFPLQRGVVTGTSYPVVRILVVFALSVGSVLDAALAPYRGKGTGETGLVRGLADVFAPGDVLLGDRYFSGYWDIRWWQRCGVEVVTRLSNGRRADFRTGRRLGRRDHVVVWAPTDRPDWVPATEPDGDLPGLAIRELAVAVDIPGFRTQTVVIVTTLTDAVAYPAAALADLYRRRWQAELNLRSLKADMGMDQLRTKTPDMVRKEFAMHLVGYNVVRRIGAGAAARAGVGAWQISFTGAWQTLNEFLPRLPRVVDRRAWADALLAAAATHRVGDRPNRCEPRAVKRRPKEYPWLTQPREAYKTHRPHGS